MERDIAQQTIDAFLKDYQAFEYFRARADNGPIMQKMMEASPFNLTVNKQWLAAFRQTGFVVHPDTRALAEQRCADIATSIPCETQFNYMKNRRQERGKLKRSLPQRAMGVVLGTHVMKTIHKFKPLETLHAPKKQGGLPKAAFGLEPWKPSMNLDKISGIKSKAPYYAPLPRAISQSAADLPMIRYAYERIDGALVEGAGINCIFKAKHRLLPQEKG